MTKYAKVRLLASLAAELNRRAKTVTPAGAITYSDAPWRAWLRRVRELFESGDGTRQLYPVEAHGLPKGDPELGEVLRRLAWLSDSNQVALLNMAARDVVNGKVKT